MRFALSCLAAVSAFVLAAPAPAAWNVAKSKHFIIYSDDNPKRLQSFAERLEKFDQSVRAAINMADFQVGDGNRLAVYVMPSEQAVRDVVHDKTGFFSGFYTGRATGSLAYVPKQTNVVDVTGQKEAIFFHEYTHHLMMQDAEQPYPQWYVEGFAEFFSTPRFEKDGGVWFGAPVFGRANGLFNGPQMPVEMLLAGLQPNLTNEQRDVFYGRGWLLSHYLLMESRRKGQLAAYIAALANGASQLDAAKSAFGDFKQLDRELDTYRNKPLLQFKIPASVIHVGPIEITPLSPGAAAMVLLRAKVKYDDEKLGALQPYEAQAKTIEAQYPGDELVETTLAEIELNLGNGTAAEVAADAALKANARNVEALVYKGRAIADRAQSLDNEEQRHAQFEKARSTFIAANKIDTEDPEPLMEFYRAFITEGLRPNANAIAALHYASDLAPQDLGLRMNSAIAYLNEGKTKEARATLTVVAYSPHGDSGGEMARRMIAAIDAGKGKAALLELRDRPPDKPSVQ
jgi:tetratricopeptide (TPR) repeat protein